MKNWCIRKKYTIVILILLLCYFGYSINKVYGFVIFPDEFGYWSYAARICGYDWSHIVSQSSYYSYGYGLILFPIFRLIQDGITAYRVAVAVNFLLLTVAFLLLKKIALKVLPNIEEQIITLMSGVAIMYPTWLFYAKTTLVEVLLMTTYLLTAYLLLTYLEDNRFLTLTLLLVALVYLYSVHMRSIATVIAVVMVLLFHMARNQKSRKQTIIGLMILLCLLSVFYMIKEWIGNTIYAEADIQNFNCNDYGGQIDKFRYLCTPQGVRDFLVSLTGKLLYLGLATWGFFYFGIDRLIKNLRKAIKEKNISNKSYFTCFLLLSTIGQILITTVYTIRGGRADAVTYGRYNEFILPIIMVVGCYELWNSKKRWMKVSGILITQLPMVWIVVKHIMTQQMAELTPYFILGIAYSKKTEESISVFYWRAYIVNSVLMLFVTAVMTLIRKLKKSYYLWVALLAMELVLAMVLTNHYMDSTQEGIFYDQQLAQRIENLLQEKNREIVYLKDDDRMVISAMQFLLREEHFTIMQPEREKKEYPYASLKQDDLVLIHYDNPCQEELKKRYENNATYGHFMLFYNE